jgi:TRAP-type C4-dicarboxylate transport system permease small subunit
MMSFGEGRGPHWHRAGISEQRRVLRVRAWAAWVYVGAGAWLAAFHRIFPAVALPAGWETSTTLVGGAMWCVGVILQIRIAAEGLRLRHKGTPGATVAI